jgi:hypothetical protein
VREVREYARAQIDPKLDAVARAAAEKAIDAALYGLMRVLDGVPSPLQSEHLRLELRTLVRLVNRDNDREAVELDLSDSDGMCMGFHYWIAGDFGARPVIGSSTND